MNSNNIDAPTTHTIPTTTTITNTTDSINTANNILPSIKQFIPTTIPTTTQSTTTQSIEPVMSSVSHSNNNNNVISPNKLIPPTHIKAAVLPIDNSDIQSLRRSSRLSEKPRTVYSKDGIRKQLSSNYIKKKKVSKLRRWKNVNSERLNLNLLAYRVSVRQALNNKDPKYVALARKAIIDELTQLKEYGTFEPKLLASLSLAQRLANIPSHIFLKEKTKADGSFDKMKARLVAGGNFIDTSLSGDISAYVVNPTTVLMMLSLAAINRLNIITCDVTGAFLIPTLSEQPSELTYVTIDKKTSDIMAEIAPEWSTRRNPNGTFTMLLKKALYGLPISASKWMTHLNETLFKLNFQLLPGDRCCFTRGVNNEMIILCSHVDDLLVIGKQTQLNIFCDEIVKEYKINIQLGAKHSYLGLDIHQCLATFRVSVSQSGFRKEICNRFSEDIYNCKGPANVPCVDTIIDTNKPSDLLSDLSRTHYMSIVMSLMYLARFTRPDIAFAVSILSTKCSQPSRDNLKHAIKLLKYVATNGDYCIVYKNDVRNIDIYADASHGIHPNGRGHGCIVVRIAGGLVFVRSYKLRLATLSSTESEWVVLCDATQLARWMKDMLTRFGINTTPIKIKQDNTSTIYLAENGPNFARTKHLLIKRNYAKEGILDGITELAKTSSESMCADMGTKPLSHRMLCKLMKMVGLMIPVVTGNIYRLIDIVVPAARINRANLPKKN